MKLSCLLTNCYRACIGRNPRPVYSRLYDVFLIRPNGSSIRIKYHEPISILKLPFDINMLNEEEKKKLILRRQMSLQNKKKVIDDDFATEDQAAVGTTTARAKYDPRKYIK